MSDTIARDRWSRPLIVPPEGGGEPVRTCSVDGCEKPHKARSYCQGHYVRVQRNGDPGDTGLRGYRTSCGVEGCDRPHLAHGLCSTHYARARSTGDPGPAEIRSGIASYSGAHAQVERANGPAAAHECRHCHVPAAQWAYDHSDPSPLYHPIYGSPYSTDADRYMPLCRPCHVRFDRDGVNA